MKKDHKQNTVARKRRDVKRAFRSSAERARVRRAIVRQETVAFNRSTKTEQLKKLAIEATDKKQRDKAIGWLEKIGWKLVDGKFWERKARAASHKK